MLTVCGDSNKRTRATYSHKQVDHAWTFAAADAHAQLESVPGLLERVASMAGVRLHDPQRASNGEEEEDACAGADSDTASDDDGDEEDKKIRPRAWSRSAVPVSPVGTSATARVLASTWRLLGFYRLAGPSGDVADEPSWFLLDEFGSAMRHCGNEPPTMRCAPFIYQPRGATGGMAFSLAWPVQDMEEGDEATRDFFHGEASNAAQRESLLACLFRTGREAVCRDAWCAWQKRQMDAHVAASATTSVAALSIDPHSSPADSRPLRVYTDIDWVQDEVRRTEFVITDSAGEAHIVWTKAQLDAAAIARLGAPATAMVNQFPGEECLVFKHRLAHTARRAVSSTGPDGWLPLSFDATQDLDALLGAHEEALETGKQPLWIMKPWNAGRSLDTTVVTTPQAVAACARSGPKVAQQYVDTPALYKGRKFDIRILVAVTRFAPTLVASLWHEVYVRVANRMYNTSPAALGDFQTSFTSMRQRGFDEETVSESQLAAEVAAQGCDWTVARQRLKAMLQDLLLAAAHDIGHCPTARALYGVDVMFVDKSKSLAPQLLEVTFCPGVERPLASDPAFLDKVFGHFFLARAQLDTRRCTHSH